MRFKKRKIFERGKIFDSKELSEEKAISKSGEFLKAEAVRREYLLKSKNLKKQGKNAGLAHIFLPKMIFIRPSRPLFSIETIFQAPFDGFRRFPTIFRCPRRLSRLFYLQISPVAQSSRAE